MKKVVFRVWHRRLGIFSFFVVIWLAISGILINHSESFSFNKKALNVKWLNDWYGIKANIPNAYLINKKYIYCVSSNLYVDEQVLASCHSPIIQLLEFEGGVLVLETEALFFLSSDGVLLDQLNFSLIGKYPESMAIVNNLLMMQGKEDRKIKTWILNIDTMALEDAGNLEMPELLDAITKIELPEKYLVNLPENGVKIERILLDAHSGRLFGSVGVIIMDIFAIFFICLSLSGFYLFVKQNRF